MGQNSQYDRRSQAYDVFIAELRKKNQEELEITERNLTLLIQSKQARPKIACRSPRKPRLDGDDDTFQSWHEPFSLWDDTIAAGSTACDEDGLQSPSTLGAEVSEGDSLQGLDEFLGLASMQEARDDVKLQNHLEIYGYEEMEIPKEGLPGCRKDTFDGSGLQESTWSCRHQTDIIEALDTATSPQPEDDQKGIFSEDKSRVCPCPTFLHLKPESRDGEKQTVQKPEPLNIEIPDSINLFALAREDLPAEFRSPLAISKVNSPTNGLKGRMEWRRLFDDSLQRTYYFHVRSGESSWELPEGAVVECSDPETGELYLYDTRCGSTTWLNC